jgi:hypothetical protein
MGSEPDRRLKDAFQAYVHFAQRTWNGLPGETAGGGNLLLIRTKADVLSAAVEAAERSSQFDDLCKAVIGWRAAVEGEPPDPEIKPIVRERLACWLRRSRTYQAACCGVPGDIQEMASRLMRDLAAERQEITHIVPIQNVRFNRNLDFGLFRISKLDEVELDKALQNDINRLFYPNAVVDTKSLSNCWLLEASESRGTPDLGGFSVFGTEADFAASGFPAPVETALENICLYGWERLITSDDGTAIVLVNGKVSVPRPTFPGFVSTSNWLFERPVPAWSLRPEGRIFFDLDSPSSTHEFERDLLLILRLELVKERAPFIQAAARFMVKALLSPGLDQLVWHITAIEALLGENSGNLVDTLKRRLSIILGTTEKDRKAARKEFADLYDFRSRLVHGDLAQLGSAGVHPGHLITARQMALAALLWMANWYLAILVTWPENQSLPSREDILRFLDMGPDSRLQLKTLLNGPALAQPDAIPSVTRQPMFRGPSP